MPDPALSRVRAPRWSSQRRRRRDGRHRRTAPPDPGPGRSPSRDGWRRGCCLHHLLVEVHERDPRYDGARPSDRAYSDPSRHPLHLDASHHARYSLGPGSKDLPKGFGLGFGHDELHDGRGVEIEKLSWHGLHAFLAELPEGIGPLGGDRPLRRSKLEEVSLGWRRPARGPQPPKGGSGLIDWTKHRHGFAALGHLESLAPLHPAQVLGEVLANLSYAHSVGSHVYTYRSIFGQTLAPLSRSEAISENLRTPVSGENDLTAPGSR
jgi:hypothetical protein